MEPHVRRTVRYEDFVKPRRRRWPWIVAAVIFVALAGAAAALWFNGRAAAHSPPPALSQAGAPVAGEAYQWKHVAIGGGGMISGLSSDAAGKTFVARTDVYGAYIWNAAANHWSQLVTAASMPDSIRTQNGAAAGVYEIVVAPSRPTRIYMALQGRIYRSDDTGKHFVQPSAGNPFPLTWDANSEFRLHGPFIAVDTNMPLPDDSANSRLPAGSNHNIVPGACAPASGLRSLLIGTDATRIQLAPASAERHSPVAGVPSSTMSGLAGSTAMNGPCRRNSLFASQVSGKGLPALGWTKCLPVSSER
jgi:hypothetical protein